MVVRSRRSAFSNADSSTGRDTVAESCSNVNAGLATGISSTVTTSSDVQ